jgi:hypothetical protein
MLILDLKSKRYFQRISAGQYLAKLHKRPIRFVTLTSSDQAKQNDISRDVDVLIKRIRRKDKTFQYWKINVLKNDRFHIHLLYTGKYITKKWLSYNWRKIHNSYIVDIKHPDNNKSVASYLITQYLADQHATYTRMSYSKRWIFPKAVQIWKNIITSVKNCYYYNTIQRKYYKNRIEVKWKQIMEIILKIWHKVLYTKAYPQTSMDDYG